MSPTTTTQTFLIIMPNGDEIDYDTQEQAVDALQYYPQGAVYLKTVILEAVAFVAREED